VSRIVVHKPFNDRAATWWGGMGGLLCGLLWCFVLIAIHRSGAATVFPLIEVLILLGFALLSVLGLIAVCILTRRCRAWATFRITLMASLGVTLSVLLGPRADPTSSPMPSEWRYALIWAIGLLGAGVFCVAIAAIMMALHWVISAFSVDELVEQDGTRCCRCGYIVGRPPSAKICPECGEFTHEVMVTAVLDRDRMNRRARVARYAFIASAAVMFVSWLLGNVRTSSEVREMLAFAGNDANVFRLAAVVPTPNPNPLVRQFTFEPGFATKTSALADSQMVLAIVWRPGERTLQLQLLADAPFLVFHADPLIFSTLDESQSDRVRDEGVPDSLVHAFVEKANASGWKPMPQGGTLSGIIEVDPTPHFPDATGSE